MCVIYACCEERYPVAPWHLSWNGRQIIETN